MNQHLNSPYTTGADDVVPKPAGAASVARRESFDPTRPHLLTVRVRETIEWEIEVDTTKPEWSWLAGSSEDPDEWVAALDDEASQTDSCVEQAIKRSSPTDAWREVEYL